MVFEPLATAEAVLTARRARARRAAGRHRRRHHRLRLFADGEIQHSGGAADRRRPLHQRPGDGAAHAVRRGRARSRSKQGCCLPRWSSRRGGIAVPSVAGGSARVVPKRELCEILQPRAEEICSTWSARTWRRTAWTRRLRGGVVLTGGGAQLDGLLEVAEQVFDAGATAAGLPQRSRRPGRRHHRARSGRPPRASCSTAAPRPTAEPRADGKSSFSVRSVMGSLRGMFRTCFEDGIQSEHGKGGLMILFDDRQHRDGAESSRSSPASTSRPRRSR